MGRIPDETLNEIRNRVDVVDLVGRYVELKKAGRNYKGLCPFHGEKTPSFNVNPDRQIFHCFGCGEGGDVVSFVMRHENLTFPEAARMLARESGIEIPETGGGDRGISERVFEANEVAQATYEKGLRAEGADAEAARQYLKGRGLTGEQVKKLGIGFVPDRWDTVANALRAKKIRGETGAEAGLLAERQSGGHYDRLRGRVVFPILDVRGRILAFGGRALGADQEPKYLNTPESPVFKKREAFYGFPTANEAIRRTGRAIICEGYFDRIALYRAEMAEALATCGTALTKEHAKQLRRRTREVVLLFDGDKAGQKAVERALEVLLPESLRVRSVSLPDGQDPDDYLAAHGAEALRAVVDGAPDALDALIRHVTADGCPTPAAKADAVERVAPLVSAVPNAVEREAYIERLAVAVGAPVDAVSSLVRGKSSAGRRAVDAPPVLAAPVARISDAMRKGFEQLARALLQDPSLASESLGAKLEECLPPVPGWQELALALAHAPLDGHLRADGAIDVHALNEALSPEAAKAFASVITSDVPWPEDVDPRSEVDRLIARFERHQRKQQLRENTEQLQRDPTDRARLEEQQRLLEERRRALNISSTRPSLGGAARGE